MFKLDPQGNQILLNYNDMMPSIMKNNNYYLQS